MTDETKIEPALTDAEWADAYHESSVFYQIADRVRFAVEEADVRDTGQLIALANAALPDDDPRKITREWVKALRGEVEYDASCVDEHGGLAPENATLFAAMADALESYLRPEGT